MQRPSAKELLQHRFVKYARRTIQLAELIERYHIWRAKTPRKASDKSKQYDTVDNGTVASAWEFDTVRSEAMASRVVTVRVASPIYRALR